MSRPAPRRALLLPVALLSLATPPAAWPSEPTPITVRAAISVCFAPEQDCAAVAIAAIDRAQRQVLVNAYTRTTGTGIVAALIRARSRGVDVRLIADKRAPCTRRSGLDALAEAGTPVWIDRRVPIAHAKVMIIDRWVTLMGSYNWTKSAARNSEDLNLDASPEVAAAYAAQWAQRAARSVPYGSRAQWCRPRPAPDQLGAE